MLLRWNWRSIKPFIFTWTIQWHLALTVLYSQYLYRCQDSFITPKGNLISIKQLLPIPLFHQLLVATICALSIWIYLIYIFHINEIIQYVISVSAFKFFFTFIHIVVRICFLIPFNDWIIPLCTCKSQFVYPFIHQ